MLATFTLEGEITHVNRAVELPLGFTREELIGKYFIETQTPARSPYTEDRHRRARGCEKLSSSLKLSSSERMAPLSRSNVAPVLHRIKMGRLLVFKEFSVTLSSRNKMQQHYKRVKSATGA